MGERGVGERGMGERGMGERGIKVGWRERGVWVGLSGAGVALLMGVSDAISEDLTVTPLLWVAPLLLYLLSFVVAFGQGGWARAGVWFPVAGVGALGLVVLGWAGWRVGWGVQLAGYCGALFAGCMALHGELWRRRPGVGGLTGFYLDVAVGGVVGGVLVAVVGPVVFPVRVELGVAVVFAFGLLVAVGGRGARGVKVAGEDGVGEVDAAAWRPRVGPGWGRWGWGWVGVVVLVVGLGVPVWRRVRGDVALYRGFFGTLQVKRYRADDAERGVVHLLDGRISHGFQWVGRPEVPTAYFVEEGGAGLVLGADTGRGRTVEVVGLGAGTLAAYARAGDRFVFYEINPDVVTVARRHFTFLADAERRGAVVEVVVGDGRQLMAGRVERGVDVVVLDAFSGDAIPAHLLTREAVAVVAERLGAGGVVVVNVANRHAALWRVAVGHAEFLGWEWARVRGRAGSPLGVYVSDWVVMGGRLPVGVVAAGEVRGNAGAGVAWTDDFAPLLPILTGF